MDNNLFDKLAQRYMAGEKITALAKDAGIPWQRLWGMLNGLPKGGQQQENPRPRKSASSQSPANGGRVSRDADGIDRITFGSVGEAVADSLADYAQTEGNAELIRERLAAHLCGKDRWAHFFTREKLLDVIAHPPLELLDAVEQMRKSLMDEVCPPQASRRRVRRNQEWGDELDAEAVLTRSLTPWERMSRENQPKRSVTVGVNLTVSARQEAEELLWRGAAAAALADILTSRGMNVEVVAFWAIDRISSASSTVVARYVVKRPDMPLDLGSVSVALAEIAFARLVALYGLARHMPGRLSKHLGFCGARLPRADAKGIDYLIETNVTNRHAAEGWLRQSANRRESEVVNV
ncbi:MAG: hypothetical protein NT031_05810 [Planctomycetota bacterium]|nr:hypothetical protein [Planctomycetota bacterium]